MVWPLYVSVKCMKYTCVDAQDVKPSPTNAGEGVSKSSPQKRKASEAVAGPDQNVTPKRRSSRVCKL